MDTATLVLIDGHALLFRAYYAFPPLTDTEGQLVNAVYGFAATLLSVIDELEPTHIAVVFDSAGPTLRKQSFEAYKAQRKPPPEDLIAQFPRAEELTKVLNIPVFRMDGYEGDDLIGTVAFQAKKLKGVQTIIVTGDLDSLQLVDDGKVNVFVPKKTKQPSILYDSKEVQQKLGISVAQVPDYKGLAGDSSDNIPGVRGIGPKTAVNLLIKYGSVEGVFAAVESGEAEKELAKGVFTKLKDSKDIALQSKQLATIMVDAPITLDLDACKVSGYDKQQATVELLKLGFKSLINRLPDDEFETDVQEALF